VAGGDANDDSAVRAQYEAYPYPARDPADEAKRLITGSPSHLLEINHYCFAGRRDWRRPFRALVAGGGTGDGLVMLAQQLAWRGTPAEIVYLDLSAASRRVAEARAAARQLGGIRFVTGSLLEVAALAPGPYDYVDCCGVLHHLADPVAGLASLAAALAPDGGIGLMVYGALGRTGVYPLQAALRTLSAGLEAPAQIALARRLLDSLPAGNWFRRNPLLADHLQGADAGLYDLLLHSRDRAYLVPEVAALLAGAGLAPTTFIEPARYDPQSYLAEPELAARAAALPWLERAALAENLAGTMKTHVVYAVPRARAGDAVAAPNGPGVVPLLREVSPERLARSLAKGEIKADFDGHAVRYKLPAGSDAIVARIDGRRSLGDIQRALALDWFAFKARFDRLYAALNGLNLLLLEAPGAT
jgi:SAM-dependent methyltransferase